MKEIERRFLVVDASPAAAYEPTRIRQCYLPDTGRWAIRFRRKTDAHGVRHSMAIKDGLGVLEREEIETPITAEVHDDAIGSAGRAVVKDRREVPHGALTIEVDTFLNRELAPLVIAEVELPSRDTPFDPPPWFGEEITNRKDLSNAALQLLIEEDFE